MSHSMMPHKLYAATNHPNSIQTHCRPHCLIGHFWLHWESLFLPKNCEILIVYSCATPSATSHEPHLFSSLLCLISPSLLILLTISPLKFQILKRRKPPHPHPEYSHNNCMLEHSFQAWTPRISTQNKLVTNRNSNLLKAGISIAGTVRQLSQDNMYRNKLLYCLSQYQHPKAFTSRLWVSLNLKEKSVAEQVCQ